MIFKKTNIHQLDTSLNSVAAVPHSPVVVPDYLEKTYWWAYTHPNAVRVFERQWLVNLILWGNFSRLRDLALQEMGEVITGDVLQVACVYGNLTEHLIRRLDPQAHLSVIDVAPVQIKNLHEKLGDKRQVTIQQQDASQMGFANASQDATLVFFLLHEMPVEVRRQTIAEALRVTKPGGKVIFVDYHKPSASSPFRYIMVPILTTLEPFAMDLWNNEITEWLPPGEGLYTQIDKQTYFGGLYQKLVVTR
ncbi:rhodoquinone biosynthesis methyltransferase RquA [Rhodoferax sp.]|uniref:rhodoquinone biosynthesis methyltransferase RquA n=1 Tax=Rhodoferax sp. TaxID=50421 RepID=UPI0028487194|nr:rhodoquinone biosynthesis methyltransferase RquA [Rhodoferax sp.]MDR3369846.1 rhodoquinone biosynthesis methyltransferase RquA [Rhodoferax sp.]